MTIGFDRVLVEVAGLKQPGVTEGALVENVVVVGVLRLQVGIADADGAGSLIRASGLPTAGGDILRIGPGKAAAVDQAKVGVLVQREAQ